MHLCRITIPTQVQIISIAWLVCPNDIFNCPIFLHPLLPLLQSFLHISPKQSFQNSNLITSSFSFPNATLKTCRACPLCLSKDQFPFITHTARDPSFKNASQIDKNNLQKWTSISREPEWGWTFTWLYPGKLDLYWLMSQFLK